MRIGVIGLGRIGRLHARNLVATTGIDQVVLLDQDPSAAAALAGELTHVEPGGLRGVGVTVAADLQQALSVDGVVIATPTPSHPELVSHCLAAGVPVLCEKPISADLETMRRLVARVEASEVPVLVGFQRRFDPALAEVHRRIRAGQIGPLYVIRTVAMDAEPPPAAYVRQSGGIFADLLIHDLDLVGWLAGEPVVEVYATGSVLVDQMFADAGDLDTVAVTLRFASGAMATLVGGRHHGRGYDHRVEVIAGGAALSVGLDPRTPLDGVEPDGIRPPGQVHHSFLERFAAAYAREMTVFRDVIAGVAGNPSPARESLRSLQWAQACERSLRAGGPVRLSGVEG